jgi:hypothetical protein
VGEVAQHDEIDPDADVAAIDRHVTPKGRSHLSILAQAAGGC